MIAHWFAMRVAESSPLSKSGRHESSRLNAGATAAIDSARPHRPHPPSENPNAHSVSGDWTLRDFEPEDENCIVSTWLKGYSHAREVAETGLESARVDGHPDEIRFWKIHQPIVEALMRSGETRLACDPQRSTHEPGSPAVVWAWACCSGDAVHWVCVKRSVVRAGLGEDIVRDLLGDRLTREQRTTFELVDLAKLKMIPREWKRDRGWLSALRSLSTRTLDRDALFARVGAHVLDTRREGWRTSTERAA